MNLNQQHKHIMTKPLRVLCSAQPFGYGPIAELIGLERALRQDARGAEAQLLLQHNGHHTALLNEVRDRFALIEVAPGEPSLESLLNDPALQEVDAVLSSYDSAAVFYGWFINRPTFFYDGLFWFWQFEQYRHCVPEYLDSLRLMRERGDAGTFVETYRRLLETDYHLTVLLAYHLSTMAFVRNGLGVAARLAAYPELAHKTQTVGAVIDPTMNGVHQEERTHVLVSLSGSLAPLLTFEQNLTFARGALMFALEAFATLNIDLPWHFCCHPKLYKALLAEGRFQRLPSRFSVTPSYDYRKNLDMIRRAFALFISPGFSSIQEAANFRTPVFFLPEQNGGQPAQLLMLREAGYDIFSCTVTDMICGGKASIAEADVEALYRGVESLWSGAMRPARIASLERFRAVLQEDTRHSVLIENQRNAAHKVFGDFAGAERVARRVLDVVT